MSRWGKPIKNKKRRDPRYFLNESVELDEAVSRRSTASAAERARREQEALEYHFGAKGEKRRERELAQAAHAQGQGQLPPEGEHEADAMEYGKTGGRLNPYHGVARFAIKASRSTKAALAAAHRVNVEIAPVVAGIRRQGTMTGDSPLERKLKQLEKKHEAIWNGPQRALEKLEAAAPKDSDAQAMLDAVYEENPKLKPGQGLSPGERSDVEEFSE